MRKKDGPIRVAPPGWVMVSKKFTSALAKLGSSRPETQKLYNDFSPISVPPYQRAYRREVWEFQAP